MRAITFVAAAKPHARTSAKPGHDLDRMVRQHEQLRRGAAAERHAEWAYRAGTAACLLAVPAVMMGSAQSMVRRTLDEGYMSRRTLLMGPLAFAITHVLVDRASDFDARACRADGRARPLEALADDVHREVELLQGLN